MTKILLIEDDAWLAELYTDILNLQLTCQVLHASTADAALDMLDEHVDVDMMVLDMFLPGHNGIEFLHEIASYDDSNTIPVIILSSVHRHDFGMSEARWRQYGVIDHLYKPATKPNDLVAAIKKHVATGRIV